MISQLPMRPVQPSCSCSLQKLRAQPPRHEEQVIQGQTELPLLPTQLPAVGIGGPAQCSLQTSEDTVRWSKGITEPRGKTSSAWDVLLLQRYHTGSLFISLFVFLSLINISGVLGTADKSAASSSSSVTHPRWVDGVTQWKGRQDYRRCRQGF